MTRAPESAERAALLGELWKAQAPPLATELGAVGALFLPAYAGVGIAALALALLTLVFAALRPPAGVVRAVILLAGPPLRYLLLVVAVWRTWVDSGQGLVPALVLLLALAFAVPMAAFLIAQSRARRP